MIAPAPPAPKSSVLMTKPLPPFSPSITEPFCPSVATVMVKLTPVGKVTSGFGKIALLIKATPLTSTLPPKPPTPAMTPSVSV